MHDPLNVSADGTRKAFAGAEDLQTPCVVVDEPRLDANIARMQSIVGNRVELHPHIKTHKSVAIARRQLAAGARGITASHAAEAAVFIRAGISPVTVAYPMITPGQVAGLLKLAADRDAELRFIVDSSFGLDVLEQAAVETGRAGGVFLKVDVGLHRCGVDPENSESLVLADRLARSKHRFMGLLSHAGHAYGAGNPDGVRKVAADERETLLRFREALRGRGIDVPRISIGSTPTMLCNDGFEGIDEARPGNYVFLDLTAVRLGIATRSEIALAVATTIISANRDVYIIDAGSKTLSSDLGPHSVGTGTAFGEAWSDELETPLIVTRLSEEHGMVARGATDLAIGDRLLIYPNHSCVVVNLAAGLHLVGGGEQRRLAIDAADNRIRAQGEGEDRD
ncbi:alanine racemase [Neorhizobium sp. Rsf11]|uniref:Alanine racemase n=1 Tax=Neorhizobium phenanthreniclasticum TaxID=3157917 RepID=A0ABV0MAF0_9HYPH